MVTSIGRRPEMGYADATRVLAAREHLVDLDAALKIVGYRLDQSVLHEYSGNQEAELRVDSGPIGQESDPVDDPAESLLVPLDHHWEDPFADDLAEEGIGWDWGGGERAVDSETGGVRNGGLVPYVLPSVEILQTQRDVKVDRIERPRSAGEHASLLQARVAEYAAAWDGRRIRDLLLRKVPGQRIDVQAVVKLLAERKPVRALPLLSRSRVALPIQIVHDIGLFTGPLGFDLQALLDVMLTSGNSGLDRISFRHSLAQGCGTGPVWEWEDYRIPRRATAVVLVSGLYGPDPTGRVNEFEHLIAALNRHGHHARAVWFGTLPNRTILRRPEHWVVVEQ
ncbi:hypothetical protein ACGFY0_25870 [Streptomyces chartreusis]|uniref:hypothetical protein n=1 Tax=Streptomyces chartreusis TaxID=1969 RepID=UPI003721424A